MRPTGQSATRAPPPYQKPSTVSTRPPRSSFPFIPSTSFRRLTFFSEASDANAYPRRDRSPDGSKNCMPLPKKPEFARIYSPVAGLLVLFCILIIARYARVWRRFKNFPLLSTFGSPAFRRLAQPNRIPSHPAHFTFVSLGCLLYILPFRQITSTTLCGFDRASFRNCASRQCTCTVLLTS